MSFKDRLLGIHFEEQERTASELRKNQQEKTEREALFDRSPYIADLERSVVRSIADKVDTDVCRALKDFADVAWGGASGGYTVGERTFDIINMGIRSPSVFWYAASLEEPRERYMQFEGHDQVCFVILKIVRDRDIPDWKKESETGGTENIDPKRLRWRTGMAKLKDYSVARVDTYSLIEHKFAPVFIIKGMRDDHIASEFGFSKETYLSNVECGLENLMKTPIELSGLNAPIPQSNANQADNERAH